MTFTAAILNFFFREAEEHEKNNALNVLIDSSEGQDDEPTDVWELLI